MYETDGVCAPQRTPAPGASIFPNIRMTDTLSPILARHGKPISIQASFAESASHGGFCEAGLCVCFIPI